MCHTATGVLMAYAENFRIHWGSLNRHVLKSTGFKCLRKLTSEEFSASLCGFPLFNKGLIFAICTCKPSVTLTVFLSKSNAILKYKCHICQKCFSWSYTLTLHLRKAHKLRSHSRFRYVSH